MATILAHITVKAGAEAQFEAIAAEMYRSTHEHETGVQRYEYWRGNAERTYYALLSFDDHRTFIAHQTSAHHKAASPALGAVIETMRLEWVDPVRDAAALPPTRHQVPPADADELTRAYTERFAALEADWWAARREATASVPPSRPSPPS